MCGTDRETEVDDPFFLMSLPGFSHGDYGRKYATESLFHTHCVQIFCYIYFSLYLALVTLSALFINVFRQHSAQFNYSRYLVAVRVQVC